LAGQGPMEFLSKIIEFLKLPKRYVWVVALVSGLLLFLPEGFLARIHVEKFAHDFGSYIGLTFLVSTLILAVELVLLAWRSLRGRKTHRERKERALAGLGRLDAQERAVLREFWIQGKNTIQLPVDQPTVVGLLDKGILETVGRLGERSTAGLLFPAKLSEAVDAHLTTSLVGLPLGEPTEEEKVAILQSRPDFVGEIEEHNDVFHSSWRGRRRLGRW